MPPPTERPRRADVERNHAAIVEASVQVLAADPTASMGAIAAHAQVSRSTLYRHFPDRESIVRAIFGRVSEEATAIVAQSLSRGVDDAVTVLADLVVELARFGPRYRFLEGLDPAPRLQARNERSLFLQGWIESAQRAGTIRNDLDAAWIAEVFSALCWQAAEGDMHDDARAAALHETLASVVRPRG